jgi:aspartyl-tRNA(Asn)/glutamyl-tRNA(Gln) amidotransferase subunit B
MSDTMVNDKYETFVGLEIHIHLLTESKMFCGCKANYGDDPNTNVCPVCLGYPGVLPTVNEEAMKMGYTVARALNCRLSRKTYFERKNYFYPDMPKNYQISQFQEPVGVEGFMEFEYNDEIRKIRIHDVHLEEDAGKMIHAGDMSLQDFNRAGYPLLEIVTEPDLKSGEETEAFLRAFRRMVRYLGVCDGNMDEGSMKCDANISINTPGAGLGTKVELKNMNSPRFVRRGLLYEAKRQAKALDEGVKLIQETRLWNENRDITESMRTKEMANDYRYFPEPDMPPFCPDDSFMADVEKEQVELPLSRKHKIMRKYGISSEQAEFIHDEKVNADYFEQVMVLGADAQAVYTWLSSDVQKELNLLNMTLTRSPLSPERFSELLKLMDEGTISGKIAKQVLIDVFEEDRDPSAIVEEKGLSQISDPQAIGAVIEKVMAANEEVVKAIREGEQKQKGFLVGQIMKETGGRAAPALVQKILSEKLR